MAILDFLNIGMKIIDKVLPDPEQKAQAQLALLKLQQDGDLAELNAEIQLATSQTDINKIEAASDDNFTRRWRPFIGWICGMAFCYHFIIQPFIVFIMASFGHNIVLPIFNMDTLNTVLMGLLGLGTMRTFEKFKK